MSFSSQEFESYVPVYDTIPENWEEARQFLIENNRKLANAVNIRTIGWYLDEELLSGNAFIPGMTIPGNNPSNYRQILRKVIDVSPLIAGLNTFPHGVTNDVNLTNIRYWVSATNSVTFENITMVYPEVVVNGTNVNITSPGGFDRANFFWEYIQEL